MLMLQKAYRNSERKTIVWLHNDAKSEFINAKSELPHKKSPIRKLTFVAVQETWNSRHIMNIYTHKVNILSA